MILRLMARGRVKERTDVQGSGVGDGDGAVKVWLKDAQRRCNMGDKYAPAIERRRTSYSKRSTAVTREESSELYCSLPT